MRCDLRLAGTVEDRTRGGKGVSKSEDKAAWWRPEGGAMDQRGSPSMQRWTRHKRGGCSLSRCGRASRLQFAAVGDEGGGDV